MLKTKIKNKAKSVKKMISGFYKRIQHRENFKANTHWLSLGENCLADEILRRHQRKSYSSLYASGRSNIEYIIQMEKDNFRHLLNRKHLQYFPDEDHRVLRSTFYADCHDYYSERHRLGFEFSHHDPLGIKEDHRAFSRRIKRVLDSRGKQNFMFLYHHRITERSQLDFIREKLAELIDLYSSITAKCQVILFWQHIVSSETPKRLEFIPHDSGILEFVCHTHHLWGGNDLDIFWAKNDDELFREMFQMVDACNGSTPS